MSTPLSEESLCQLKDAILAGRTIEAIKLHREATGSGLVEAKEFADKLEAKLRAEEPGKFPAQPSSRGCSSIFLGLFVVFGLVLFLPAAWAIGSNLLFSIGAERAQGVVVKHNHWTPFPWPTHVVLRPGSLDIELTPTRSKWGTKQPAIGTRVPILVRKDRPGEARLDGGEIYGQAGLACVVGLGTIALPMIVFWSWHRAAKAR